MKKIILDGTCFSDEKGFDLEIKKVLTKNIAWIDYKNSIGLNMNSFNDFLKGGFGVTDYEEPFQLIWKDAKKSEENLSHIENEKTTFNAIIDIITANKHIVLKLE